MAVSTVLYWSLIEAGLAIIAACLPTLRCLIGKVSLSSIVYYVRNALSVGSKYTQEEQFAASSNKSYANIRAGSSSSSTSRVQMVVKEKSGPVDTLAMGDVDGLETTEYGIQVTRQFSQHVSMVWSASSSMDRVLRIPMRAESESSGHRFYGDEWAEFPKYLQEDFLIHRHSTKAGRETQQELEKLTELLVRAIERGWRLISHQFSDLVATPVVLLEWFALGHSYNSLAPHVHGPWRLFPGLKFSTQVRGLGDRGVCTLCSLTAQPCEVSAFATKA